MQCEMRVFDGRLGIAAALPLADGWIFGRYADRGRRRERDERSTGGPEGIVKSGVRSQGARERRTKVNGADKA